MTDARLNYIQGVERKMDRQILCRKGLRVFSEESGSGGSSESSNDHHDKDEEDLFLEPHHEL
eukprot:6282715-Karenia_brevis.AAC.1